MKKILITFLFIFTLITISSCGKKEENVSDPLPDKVTEAVSPTEIPVPSPIPTEEPTAVPSPTDIPADTALPTEEPAGNITEIPEITPTGEPSPIPSEVPLSFSGDTFFPVDFDSQSLLPVYEAYFEYLNNRSWDNDSTARFSLAYIDNDEIPELLAFDGDAPENAVEIIKYDSDDTKARRVEAFGSSGTIAYLPGSGRIYSVQTESDFDCYYTHVINGFSAELYTALEKNEALSEYIVNGIATDTDTFNDSLTKQLEQADEAETITYTDSVPLTVFDSLSSVRDVDSAVAVFKRINAVISQGDKFILPNVQGIDDIRGSWVLYYGLVTDSASGEIITSDSCDMTAWLYITPDGDMSFSCSLDKEFYSDKSMTYEYTGETLADLNEYAFWTANLSGESPNNIYKLTACTENDTEYLYLTFETLISDADTRTFDFYLKRENEAATDSCSTAYIKFNKKASDLDNNIAAFTCQRFIFVNAEQTELIEKYGLQDSFDGFDYVIVRTEDEPFIIYADTEKTTFKLLTETDGEISYTNVAFEEFHNQIKLSPDGLITVSYYIDSSLNDCTLSYFIQEITAE